MLGGAGNLPSHLTMFPTNQVGQHTMILMPAFDPKQMARIAWAIMTRGEVYQARHAPMLATI